MRTTVNKHRAKHPADIYESSLKVVGTSTRVLFIEPRLTRVGATYWSVCFPKFLVRTMGVSNFLSRIFCLTEPKSIAGAILLSHYKIWGAFEKSGKIFQLFEKFVLFILKLNRKASVMKKSHCYNRASFNKSADSHCFWWLPTLSNICHISVENFWMFPNFFV